MCVSFLIQAKLAIYHHMQWTGQLRPLLMKSNIKKYIGGNQPESAVFQKVVFITSGNITE